MSKKANPTLVGTFVLAALAVALAAVMALGSFRFKDNSVRCVAFFSGSMHGLDVGAPVTFRGVNIGRVSSVQLDYDDDTETVIIPVYMELRPDIHPRAGLQFDPDELRRNIQALIKRGLKARMQTSSLLTGKQYVELSLKPDKEPSLKGSAPGEYIEIPTVSSGLDKIAETLESLPLEEILGRVAKTLDSLNNAVSSGKAAETMQHLMSSVNQLEAVLTNLNQSLPGLLGEVNKVLGEASKGVAGFSGTMREASGLLADARKDLKPTMADLRKLLANLQSSSGKLTKTLGNLEHMTADNSDLNYQLRDTLREVQRAAGSLNELIDFLRRNPNALFFGADKEK